MYSITAGEHDSASQISRSLPRQDTSDTEHTVDLNIFNDEMRLRNNIENMYKKGKIMTLLELEFNISSVMEFQRWWVLKSKLFAQKSTCSKEILIPTTLNHL